MGYKVFGGPEAVRQPGRQTGRQAGRQAGRQMKHRIDLNCNVPLFNPVPTEPSPVLAAEVVWMATVAETVATMIETVAAVVAVAAHKPQNPFRRYPRDRGLIRHSALLRLTQTSELLEFFETEFKNPHNVPEQKGIEEKGRDEERRESSRERARQGRNATASSWVSLRGEKTSPADKGEYV
ncbi:hypothetical protein V1478_004165 [Vespula squamosa]|uniref:Uncharacterized protein n=1 Tax=Vespula squamosa TaxID=30214 RepID=A0ABD2BNX3_VESSQ